MHGRRSWELALVCVAGLVLGCPAADDDAVDDDAADDDVGDDDVGDDDTGDDDVGEADDDTGDDDVGDDDSAPPGCELCGINLDPANPAGNPTTQQLIDAGVTHVRLVYKDSTAGLDPDPAALTTYANLAAMYDVAGLEVLMVLCYESYPGKPAFTAGDDAWTSYSAAFVERVADVVAALGDDVWAYEIWNEEDHPEHGGPYDPGVPAHIFGTMLQGAHDAIQAGSAAHVVMGGLDSGNPGYVADVAAATGGVLYADYVGVHPYGQRPDPTWPSADWGFGYVGDLLDAYLAVGGVPLWITEAGTNDSGVQAEYLTRMYARLASSYPTAVPYLTWFCWSDGMVSPYGIVDAAGAPKDAYWAFQAFAQSQ